MLTSCAITADIKPNPFAVLSCAVLLFLAANATAASRLACRLPCAKDVLQLSFLKASSYIAIRIQSHTRRAGEDSTRLYGEATQRRMRLKEDCYTYT